jgi:hypothetical protein
VTRRGAGPHYVFVDRGTVGDMGTVRALAFYGEFDHLLRDEP